MRIFKRRGSELVDPQLTGLRFDQVGQMRKMQKLLTVMSFVRGRMRKCSKGGNVKI